MLLLVAGILQEGSGLAGIEYCPGILSTVR